MPEESLFGSHSRVFVGCEMLYQYRGTLDENGLDYLAALFEFGHVLFSRPIEFNDPFDVYPNHMGERWPEFPSAKSPDALRRANHDYFNMYQQDMLSIDIGISCFTTNPANMLMWSHYGDSHRSICVGFDPEILVRDAPTNEEGKPLYHGPFKVNYSNMRADLLGELLVTKARAWAYEEEFRMISDSDIGHEYGPGVWPIPKHAISEIVLGARMDFETAEAVKKLVVKHMPDLKIRCVLPDPQTFDLHLEDLDEQPRDSRWFQRTETIQQTFKRVGIK